MYYILIVKFMYNKKNNNRMLLKIFKISLFVILFFFNILKLNSQPTQEDGGDGFGNDSNKFQHIINKNSAIEKIKDTIYIIQKNPDNEILKNYQEILEKTNNQLSLWFNPYGILIGLLAIFSGFFIFFQSRDFKRKTNKLIQNYSKELDKIINEKNNLVAIFKADIDSMLIEYGKKLPTITDNKNSSILQKIISKLKNLRKNLDVQINTYKHSGWQQRDIIEDYSINENTRVLINIKLSNISQSFVIYFKVLTSNNKKYWIGFAGNNNQNKPYLKGIEYKLQKNYNSDEINMEYNIFSVFKQGFTDTNLIPVKINCVRLRGNKNDSSEITFSYRFVD